MGVSFQWNFWGLSSHEHQEELLAYDGGFSEVHTSIWLLCGIHGSPLWLEDSGALRASCYAQQETVCMAGSEEHVLWLADSWEALSVVFHSQTSSGLCGRLGHASQHVWHGGLGCKIYPAWQLVKELCNRHQLTETTVRCFLGGEMPGFATLATGWGSTLGVWSGPACGVSRTVTDLP